MADYEELRTALRWLLLSQLSPMPRYMRGRLGNGQGKVAVPDRPGFCYVRPSHSTDDTIEVFNKEVSGGDGTPVLVGELPWQPGLTQIVSVDWEIYIQVGWGDGYAGVALHGPTHEWRDGFVGTDAFNVFRRQIAPMRTYPVGSGSHSVNIAPYDYIYGGNPISWCGLPGLDLSPAVPATGTARLMLTYLDMESNVAGVVTGSLDVHSDAVELSRPALPTGTWAPSAYVRLYGGQPGILEGDISDARQLWAGISATPSGPAGGDLTGSYPNPIVVGLNDYPIRDTTPAEGYGLMYTGSAWSPIPWPGTTGPAGGDLTGTYPNPMVIGLQGYPVLDTVPQTGYGLMYTGSAWSPIPWPSGSGSPTGPAGGDLTGSYPNPLVVGIYNDPIDTGVSPVEGDVLVFSASGTNYWRPADHGYLGGLSDDDHPQYLLIDGTRAMTGELDAALGISLETGQEIKFDTDDDTSIRASADDALTIKIATSDKWHFNAAALEPVTNNDVDLGTASMLFKNAYFHGLQFDDAAELTISGGAVTKTQTYHDIDTEGDAATDDLDTINGGSEGDILIIRAEHDDRTVIVKHSTGNIELAGGVDITLDSTEDHLLLIFDGSNWCNDSGDAAVVKNVTKTVGTGKDFTTILGAIAWFQDKLISGDCVISVDAGSYDEAVVFDGIVLAAGATLTLQGDTRVLAGIAYVDGASMNQAGLANGGSGVCTLATNAARDEITVTGATTDPDFDADGWGSGDEIVVYADDGNMYDRTINSISPGGVGNNVIEITVALPGGATLGNDGTAIGLKPDRQIERSTAGECLLVDAIKGISVDGWYLESGSGAACYGLRAQYMAKVELTNVLAKTEDHGISCVYGSTVLANTGALSWWGSSYGPVAQYNATIMARYSVIVATTSHGYYCLGFSFIDARSCIVTSANRAYYSNDFSWLDADHATARQNTVGYYASNGSAMDATNTNAQNNGNGADYSPAVSNAFGNNNGFITWS